MQQFYPYLLLIHIVSALALFACEGVGIVSTQLLKRARDIDGFRTVLAVTKSAGGIGKFAPLLLLLTGLALSLITWGGLRLAWVNLSLLIFVLIALGVNFVDAKLLRRLEAQATAGDFAAGQTLARSRALSISTILRLTALLGLVFLMTLKPTLVPALLGLSLIFAVGLGVALKSHLGQLNVPQIKQV